MSVQNNLTNYDLRKYVSDVTELCCNAMDKYRAPLSEMSLLSRFSMVNVCHREETWIYGAIRGKLILPHCVVEHQLNMTLPRW